MIGVKKMELITARAVKTPFQWPKSIEKRSMQVNRRPGEYEFRPRCSRACLLSR